MNLAALILIAMILGADAAQMQAVIQQVDDIMEYAGIPDVEQAEKDSVLAQKLNTFFTGEAVKLYTGDYYNGHGLYATTNGPNGWKPGHIYIYNGTIAGQKGTLYFEVIQYPHYDFESLPDWLKRELWYNYTDFQSPPEPLVVYYQYRDVKVPWAGDRTSLNTFLSRMLLLAKLIHIDYGNPIEYAEKWSNYLDRYLFDFNDLDYIYRNFPLFLENPWLWLKSGSSLNTLMELIGSGITLNNFPYISGDNPIYNFLENIWKAEEYHQLWKATFNHTDAWQLAPLEDGTWVPLPHLVTLTSVLEEMGLLELFGEADYSLHGAHSNNWSLTLNGANSTYSYQFILSSAFNPQAKSTPISSCSNTSAWNTTGENVSLTTDGYSIIVSVAGNHSNTTTLTYNLTQPLNLSSYDSLLLWFYMNATRSDFATLKITLYDEEQDYKEYDTWTYNTSQKWVRLTLDLDEPDSQGGIFGNLANITITTDPVDVLNYTFWVDDVRVSSHILSECIWDTYWEHQLLSGNGATNITVWGFPYTHDYPYSVALEWNLTQPGGSASYTYDPHGAWSLNPQEYLAFMLYGFGTQEQNVSLRVRLCTDGNNYLEYDFGVDWYGWRKVVIPLTLMNETGTANLSRVDYVEFQLEELSNGSGMLVLSDVEVDCARWVKVEFVVPESVRDADGDNHPQIELHCWNGSNWTTVAKWDANDSNSSMGEGNFWNDLVFLDGTPASSLFSLQGLCLYPVGTGSQSPYSGDAGNINYTTGEASAGFALMMPPPSPGNQSSVLFRVEVHYDSTNHYVNSHDYPLAFFYFNSSFTNLTLTAKDTQDNEYQLFYGNGSTVLLLNLESALGHTARNLAKFQACAENVTLIYGVFSSLDNWTVDSLNSTVFILGGERIFVQGSQHLYLNYTFNPPLNINYENVFMDLVYCCSYSYPENETNLTLWLNVDSNWLNITLPHSEESRRIRIPLSGSSLGGLCFEHQTNTTVDWFSVQEIEVFHLTNITQYVQGAEGYMNETSLSCPGFSPRFTQLLSTAELPVSLSAWAYVYGSSSLIVEFFDENGTFLDSYTASGNGSSWNAVCLVDLTVPSNASTLKFIVAAEKLDHAYLAPSMLTCSGIYESFNSLRGWFIVGNGTAENNTQGLTVTLGEGETVSLWTDVSVLGFDFSRFDTVASAYNISGNTTGSIIFEWLLVDADGNTVRYQSQVNLTQDSYCAVDPISKYYKVYAPIPFPYADCVENFTYTNFDLNRIFLNFSGVGVMNVSWVQTQYIPDWNFISVSENVSSTHLYVNWLTKSLVLGGVFNSTGGEPNWVGVMHTYSQDVNLTTNPILEVTFRTQNVSLSLGLEVLVYDEQAFTWEWRSLPPSSVIFEYPVYTPSFINVPEYLLAQEGHLYTALRAIRIYVNDTRGEFEGLGSLEISSIWLHPACGAPLSFLVLDDFEADDLSRWQEASGWLLPYTDLALWTSNIVSDSPSGSCPPGWEDGSFLYDWHTVHSSSSNGDVLTWTPLQNVSQVYSVCGSRSDTEAEEMVGVWHKYYPEGGTMRLGRIYSWACLIWPYYWVLYTYVQRVFVRFRLEIPEGATITSAYLSFKSATTEGNTFTARIRLLDYSDCPEFYSNPYTDFPKTDCYVDWSVPATTEGAWYNTSNIKTLIQNYIDRPGDQEGCYIGLYLYDIDITNPSGLNYQEVKHWYAYDGGAGGAPKLYVNYNVNGNYSLWKSISVDTGDFPSLNFRARSSKNSTIRVALGSMGDKYYHIFSFNLTTSYQNFALPVLNGFPADRITVYYPQFPNATVNIDYIGLRRPVNLMGAVTNESLSENGGFESQNWNRWPQNKLASRSFVDDPNLVYEGRYSAKITCTGTGQYLYREGIGDNIVRFSIYKPLGFNSQRKYFFQLHDTNPTSGKDITFYLVDTFETNVGSHEANNKKLKWTQKPGTYADYFIDVFDLYQYYWGLKPKTVEVRFGVESTPQESAEMIIDDFRVYDRLQNASFGLEVDEDFPFNDHESLKLSYSFASQSNDVCIYTYTLDRDFSQEEYFQLWVYGDNSGNRLNITLHCRDGTYGGWGTTINWTEWKKLTYRLDQYHYQSQALVSGKLEKIVFRIDDEPDSKAQSDGGWILLNGLLFGHQYNFTLTSESWSGQGAARINNPGGGWVKVYAKSSSLGRIPFTPDEVLCFSARPTGKTPWAVMVDFAQKDGATKTIVWYRGERPIPQEYAYDYLVQLDASPDSWNEYRLNMFDAIKNYAEMSGVGGFQHIEQVAFLVGPGEVVFDSVLVRNVPENLDTSPLSVLSSPVILFYDEAYPCSLGEQGNNWSLVNHTLTMLECELKAMNISVVWANAHQARRLMSTYPRSLVVIAGSIVPDTLCGREGYSFLENYLERGGTVVFLSDDYAPVSAVGREGYETLWFRGVGLEYLLDVKSPTIELFNYSSLEPLSLRFEATDAGGTLGALDSVNASGFAWLVPYLRYQNVWVEVYYYNDLQQLGRGVCVRPRDSLGYVAEFPITLILEENDTGVVSSFISDHFINLWLDTSGFNFDDYEHPIPGVSDEHFMDYYGEWKSGSWNFDTNIPQEEYFAYAEFNAFWHLYVNATLNANRNDSVVCTYLVNPNSSVSISEFPFFTFTVLTIGNYTRVRVELNVSGQLYTLLDESVPDWRKYVWYLPSICLEGEFSGVRVTVYENMTEGAGNASVTVTDLGAYTVAVPEYGFPKALGVEFHNTSTPWNEEAFSGGWWFEDWGVNCSHTAGDNLYVWCKYRGLNPDYYDFNRSLSVPIDVGDYVDVFLVAKINEYNRTEGEALVWEDDVFTSGWTYAGGTQDHSGLTGSGGIGSYWCRNSSSGSYSYWQKTVQIKYGVNRVEMRIRVNDTGGTFMDGGSEPSNRFRLLLVLNDGTWMGSDNVPLNPQNTSWHTLSLSIPEDFSNAQNWTSNKYIAKVVFGISNMYTINESYNPTYLVDIDYIRFFEDRTQWSEGLYALVWDECSSTWKSKLVLNRDAANYTFVWKMDKNWNIGKVGFNLHYGSGVNCGEQEVEIEYVKFVGVTTNNIYDYLFSGDSDYPYLGLKFNDTRNSTLTITREYPQPYSFLKYPYLEVAFQGTGGNYTLELWLNRKYSPDDYTWVLLDAFNFSESSPTRKVVGYNLYAEFNAYSEFFNPETANLKGWRIIIKGHSQNSSACLFTLRYIALTDYYTGWRIYPGGANYTGGEGYSGEGYSQSMAADGEGLESGGQSLGAAATITEGVKPSQVDVSEVVSWEDHCLGTDGWSVYGGSGVESRIVSLEDYVELQLRRAAAGDWAMFHYDLGGGVDVSLTNFLKFKFRIRPEGGLRVIVYAEVSGSLVELGDYPGYDAWTSSRINVLSKLADAGANSSLVTGLVFKLVREGDSGRYNCYAAFDLITLSGYAAWTGGVSSLFFNDDICSLIHFEGLRGATLVYNVPTKLHSFDLSFNASYFLENTGFTVNVYFYNFSSGSWVMKATLNQLESWQNIGVSIDDCFVRAQDGRFLVYLEPQDMQGPSNGSTPIHSVNVNLKLDWAEVCARTTTENYLGFLLMSTDGLPTDLGGVFDQLGGEVVWSGEDSSYRRVNYWLQGWSYRKPITVTEETGLNLTNFQVKIILQGNNPQQGNYIDFNKVAEGGADLRVTADDGLTLVDFWIESWSDVNRNATLWIECPLLKAGQTTTYYIYYGSEGVESISNGEATFLFFDDFSGTSLDGEKWSAIGNVTVGGGVCTIGGGSTESRIETLTRYGNMTVVQTRARVSDNWNNTNPVTKTFTVDGTYSDTEAEHSPFATDNYPTSSTMRSGKAWRMRAWPWWIQDEYIQRSYVRFLLDIPAGSTISSAYLKLKCAASDSATRQHQIHLLDQTSCGSFSQCPYDWSTTGSPVYWDIGSTTKDSWYTSPDIKSLVQAFIDRAGYTANNYIGLRLIHIPPYPGIGNYDCFKKWYQYDSGSGNAPQLIVNYYPPGSEQNMSAVVSLGDYSNPDPYDVIFLGRMDSYNYRGHWVGAVRDYPPASYTIVDTSLSTDTGWHVFQLEWRGANSAGLWVDSSSFNINQNSVPDGDNLLRVTHQANGAQRSGTQLYVDYTFVRKYAPQMPTVNYGGEQTPPNGSSNFYVPVGQMSGSEMVHFYWHMLENVSNIGDYYLEFRLDSGVGAVFEPNVLDEPNARLDLYKELRLWLSGVVEPPTNYAGNFSDLNITVRLYVQYYYENSSAIGEPVLFNETVIPYHMNGEWIQYVLEVPGRAPQGARSWTPIIRATGHREDSFCHLFLDDVKCPQTYQKSTVSTSADIVFVEGHGHVLNCSSSEAVWVDSFGEGDWWYENWGVNCSHSVVNGVQTVWAKYRGVNPDWYDWIEELDDPIDVEKHSNIYLMVHIKQYNRTDGGNRNLYARIYDKASSTWKSKKILGSNATNYTFLWQMNSSWDIGFVAFMFDWASGCVGGEHRVEIDRVEFVELGADRTIWGEYLNIPFSPDLLFGFDVYPVAGGWWLGLKFRVQLYEFLTSYNATVNVSSPLDYVGPVDFNLSFEGGSCRVGSLFVMDCEGNHVPFTIRSQTVSGDHILNATIGILVNVSGGSTKTFRVFWSDYENPLPELVSPNLQLVNWSDNTQTKTVYVNCTATDANLSRVILHYYTGSWNQKDMSLAGGFYVASFSYSGTYQFYVEALDNASNTMRTRVYPGGPPGLYVDVGEGEVYIRDRVPSGTDVVWLYYCGGGAEKYLNSTLDSLKYGYVLDCGGGVEPLCASALL